MSSQTPPDAFSLLLQLQRALREQPGQALSEWWESYSGTPAAQAELLTPNLLQQHLYAQIARPWERLKRDKPKKSALKKIPATQWATFEIVNLHPHLSRKPMTLSFVLELLRNAISHDKVRWDKELNATFSDWDSNKLRFSMEEIQRFIAAFQAFRKG